MRAFTTGLTPLTIGLLMATGWVLAQPHVRDGLRSTGAIALIAFSVAVMLRTRLSPIWLVAVGAVIGALGGV